MARVPMSNHDLKVVAALVALIFALALVCVGVMLLPGCATCKSLEQRCNQGKAELCDSAGKWRPVMDCDKLTTPYAPAGDWACSCATGKCACRRK